MRVVLLPTVPHTGTHFVAAFLERTGEIGHHVSLDQLAKNPCAFRDPQTGHEGLRPGVVNLVRGHIRGGDDESGANAAIGNLAAHWTPLVPLRDPLATLVSFRSRTEGPGGLDLLARWVTLIEFVGPFLAPHFIPLDLLTDYADRVRALRDLLVAAGLGQEQSQAALVRSWAHEWPKDRYNSVGVTPLKVAYAARDLAYLRKHGLGHEIDTLAAQERVFRPWLEARGYKHLIWWS